MPDDSFSNEVVFSIATTLLIVLVVCVIIAWSPDHQGSSSTIRGCALRIVDLSRSSRWITDDATGGFGQITTNRYVSWQRGDHFPRPLY